MGRVDHWRIEGALRRIASVPHAPALASIILTVAGAAQSVAWAAANAWINTQVNAGELEVAMILPSVAATVPLGLLWGQPAIAALIVTAACLLTMLFFHMLAVACLITALVLLGRLGWADRQQWLAPVLATFFLVLALIEPAGSPVRTSTVLLAALGQAAAWAGIAIRARSEATEHSAARQVIAGSLFEHTARGTGPHLQGTARRCRPSHLDDRRPGRDGQAHHPGPARDRGSATVIDRRHRPLRADRDAAVARRAARGHGHRVGRVAAAAKPAPAQ